MCTDLCTYILPFVPSNIPLSFYKLRYNPTTLCTNIVFDIFLIHDFHSHFRVSHVPELRHRDVFPALIVIIGHATDSGALSVLDGTLVGILFKAVSPAPNISCSIFYFQRDAHSFWDCPFSSACLYSLARLSPSSHASSFARFSKGKSDHACSFFCATPQVPRSSGGCLMFENSFS